MTIFLMPVSRQCDGHWRNSTTCSPCPYGSTLRTMEEPSCRGSSRGSSVYLRLPCTGSTFFITELMNLMLITLLGILSSASRLQYPPIRTLFTFQDP
ncbi:hypothetical protein BDZ89DRAFT_144962 [Hymenopellis radicata]|nr:hypothetical protein BDZ89DRAFT_144962 [Hymenopellis radicata]